jgi:hypothetical protein
MGEFLKKVENLTTLLTTSSNSKKIKSPKGLR